MGLVEISWNYVKTLIENNEIDKIVRICKRMKVRELQFIKSKLIEEIQSTNDKKHRNTIAIVLGDLKCNEAIEVFVDLINNPQNKNCRGTLIYALQELNCESVIKNIINVLFDGNLEVKCNMYNLLLEKVEYMSKKDRLECVKLLKEEKRNLEEKIELLEDIEQNIFASDIAN